MALLSVTAFLHDLKADSTSIWKVDGRISANFLRGTTDKADNNNSVMMIIPHSRDTCESIKELSQDHFRLEKADIEHMRAQPPHFTLNQSMHSQGNNHVFAVGPFVYTCRFLPTPHARNPMLEAFGQP